MCRSFLDETEISLNLGGLLLSPLKCLLLGYFVVRTQSKYETQQFSEDELVHHPKGNSSTYVQVSLVVKN